jgi:methionyl-tRNA synthetase
MGKMTFEDFMSLYAGDVELEQDETPYCDICENYHPVDGTKTLITDQGHTWLEFCEDCGARAHVVTVETGEKMSLTNMFKKFAKHPKAVFATSHYIH